LFGREPDYNFLRVFGCACWPNLRPYNAHKLEFRSKRCAFLGYSPLHKGYKCLDISTGRVYISRDVIFDENVFPFSELHPNAGARLRSEINLLHPTLLNLGGETVHDQHTNATNIPCLSGDDVSGSADDTNSVQNDDEDVAPVHEITSSSDMEHKEDPPSSPAQSGGQSSSGLAPIIGLSGANGGEEVMSSVQQQRTATQQQAPSAPTAATGSSVIGVPRTSTSVESTGHKESEQQEMAESSVPSTTVVQAAAVPQYQHGTRFQSGIRKEKVYTDGTVRYSFLTTSGEPWNTEEAFV
jgi:hypothetical protein